LGASEGVLQARKILHILHHHPIEQCSLKAGDWRYEQYDAQHTNIALQKEQIWINYDLSSAQIYK